MSLGRKTRSGKAAPPSERAAQMEEDRVTEAAKIARLRALRLTKEAADRSAEEEAAAARARLKLAARVRGQPRTQV
jgi:hypothetical protein